MTSATNVDDVAIRRLAGLANVISALLGAIPILAPETQMDALQTCASMAADVADELESLLGAAS